MLFHGKNERANKPIAPLSLEIARAECSKTCYRGASDVCACVVARSHERRFERRVIAATIEARGSSSRPATVPFRGARYHPVKRAA